MRRPASRLGSGHPGSHRPPQRPPPALSNAHTLPPAPAEPHAGCTALCRSHCTAASAPRPRTAAALGHNVNSIVMPQKARGGRRCSDGRPGCFEIQLSFALVHCKLRGVAWSAVESDYWNENVPSLAMQGRWMLLHCAPPRCALRCALRPSTLQHPAFILKTDDTLTQVHLVELCSSNQHTCRHNAQ